MGCCANLAELPGWARDLLDRSRVGRLGLIDDDGRPRVLPVTYAISGTTLVSAIDHKPKRVPGEELARVRWLRSRPQAALTVDHYAEDWSELAWVQVLGDMRVLAASEEPDAVDALAGRYREYRVSRPSGLLLSLEPERIVWWRASAGVP